MPDAPASTALSTDTSIKGYLANEVYKKRFEEVLGARAPQFMASLITISQGNLSKCSPKSVIASAMIAATLDLPIEKNLGFAHIVPYGDEAQFQMGYKGYIQLALRSGQYQRMNARPVNAEAFRGWDDVGEPIIDWDQLDESKEAVGYVFAFKMINGFTKVAYWSKAKVEDHANRFSQAVIRKKKDSPWFTNFDKMALKTVVMNELRSWGMLSVQMQKAITHDMGAQADLEAEVTYPDGTGPKPTEEPQAERKAPPARSGKGAAGVAENPPAGTPAKKDDKFTGPTVEGETVPPGQPASTPAPAADKTTQTSAAQAPVSLTSLAEKQTVTVKCEVVSIEGILIGSTNPVASIRATVKGEYEGIVYHRGGGTIVAAESNKPEEATVAPNKEWVVGKTLILTLLGKAKNMVSVEGLKEAPATVAME